MNIYINSHDNLIISIYKEESILLPTEIGTLEFDRIANKKYSQEK